jgi:hypothetical protein
MWPLSSLLSSINQLDRIQYDPLMSPSISHIFCIGLNHYHVCYHCFIEQHECSASYDSRQLVAAMPTNVSINDITVKVISTIVIVILSITMQLYGRVWLIGVRSSGLGRYYHKYILAIYLQQQYIAVYIRQNNQSLIKQIQFPYNHISSHSHSTQVSFQSLCMLPTIKKYVKSRLEINSIQNKIKNWINKYLIFPTIINVYCHYSLIQHINN